MAPPTDSHLIELHALQLDDARALLKHDAKNSRQEAGESPAAYLQRVLDGLCELSLKDPLTGLGNRRHFRSVLERSIEAVARSGDSVLLLLLDIDHFKTINDRWGHLGGDHVLQDVARRLKGTFRKEDTVGRYGGEEFVALVVGCAMPAAMGLAERFRLAVSRDPFDTGSGMVVVTTSVGVAVGTAADGPQALLKAADEALYRAKETGRNRSVAAAQLVS